MRKAASYEKLFPELHEPHPTRTLEVKDKMQWFTTLGAVRVWSAGEVGLDGYRDVGS